MVNCLMSSQSTEPEAFVFLSHEEIAALTAGEKFRYLNGAVAEIERLQHTLRAHDKALNASLERLRLAGTNRG